jgi:hypothetical protein
MSPSSKGRENHITDISRTFNSGPPPKKKLVKGLRKRYFVREAGAESEPESGGILTTEG